MVSYRESEGAALQCLNREAHVMVEKAAISAHFRKLMVEERGLRESRRSTETVVLSDLRYHKLHSKRPDTTILVFSAGRSAQPSGLRIASRATAVQPQGVDRRINGLSSAMLWSQASTVAAGTQPAGHAQFSQAPSMQGRDTSNWPQTRGAARNQHHLSPQATTQPDSKAGITRGPPAGTHPSQSAASQPEGKPDASASVPARKAGPSASQSWRGTHDQAAPAKLPGAELHPKKPPPHPPEAPPHQAGDMDGLLSELLEMELAADVEVNKKAIQLASRGGQLSRGDILNRAAELLLGQQCTS